MPPRTIVLQVKCSTVKKIDEILPKVIWYEIVAASLSNLLYVVVKSKEVIEGIEVFNTWGMSPRYLNLPCPVTIENFGLLISTCISVFVIIYILARPADIVIAFVINNWPRFECIKDEPEEP